jgi:SAM-dependent methyltransferase
MAGCPAAITGGNNQMMWLSNLTWPLVGPWSTVDQQMKFFFANSAHPFRILQETIERQLSPGSSVLEIGCGRDARMLQKLVGKARFLYGIDIESFRVDNPAVILLRENVCSMKSIPNATIDLVYSKSVMEHVDDVVMAYAEINRVLSPGGKCIILTPNLLDYASIISCLVPNRYHPGLVHALEGRKVGDVFPTFYRSNTKRRIYMLAAQTGFRVSEFSYLGQYPNYLTFSRSLFWVGCLYERMIGKLPSLRFLRGWILSVLEKKATREDDSERASSPPPSHAHF